MISSDILDVSYLKSWVRLVKGNSLYGLKTTKLFAYRQHIWPTTNAVAAPEKRGKALVECQGQPHVDTSAILDISCLESWARLVKGNGM